MSTDTGSASHQHEVETKEVPSQLLASPPLSESVWKNRHFLMLWAGQAVTQLGSEVTLLALPLVATIVLKATPLEMGILMAAEQLPPLLIGLFVGALVDRASPKMFLVSADLGRVILLGMIAGLAHTESLTIAILCLIALLIGACRTIFDVSYGALLPSILPRRQIVEGNAQLGMARSVSEIAGPPIGGFLIQALSAANALLIDALSFLLSAISIFFIRLELPAPAARKLESSIWREIAAGMRAVQGHSVRRAMLLASASWNLFYALIMAVFFLHLAKLQIRPATLGIALVPGGFGFMAGAASMKRLAHKMGIGTVAILGISITTSWGALVALADGENLQVMITLMIATFLFGFGQALYNIASASIRQLITRAELMGRVTAISSVIYRSTLPAGALLGGFMGDRIGLRQTIIIGTLGLLGSAAPLALSKVRGFRGDFNP